MKRLFAIAVLGVFLAAPGMAQNQAFDIQKFTANITINKDASIVVEERIDVHFNEERHGIYRTIPISYKDQLGNNVSLRLKVLSVKDENGNDWQYDISRGGGNLTIKIGDPDTLISGDHSYVIAYEAPNALLFFKDHDELYWNITGTEWEVPISNVSAEIKLPESIDPSKIQTSCYTGAYGSKEQQCTSSINKDNTISFAAQDFLTVAVGFPKGIVKEPSTFQRLQWFVSDNWPIAFPILVFLILYYVWWKYGRDPKGRGTIVVEFDPPLRIDAPKDFLSPAEVGTLLDQKVRTKDISATIISFAVRGYVKIKEETEKHFFGNSYDFILMKLKDPKDLQDHEQEIWDFFFQDRSEFHLKDLKDDLGEAKDFLEARKNFEKDLYSSLVSNGFFTKNPNTVRGAFTGIGIAMAFFAFWGIAPFGFAAFLAFFFSGILFIIFGQVMPKKTKKGAISRERALGLKEYLITAEKYRMQWQEKEGIFETLLPYAMVFGVVSQWAKNFADLYKEPPSWYEGSYGVGFQWILFTSSFDRFSNQFNSVAVSHSTGSSGLGGGGFSGGGGGGGGGGSW